jgi:hypothetical protein
VVGKRSIAILTVLLATSGCGLLFSKTGRVDECTPEKVSSSQALEKAPVWVPGSPMRAGLPTTGCLGGDGKHHTDRLCAVSEVTGKTAISQAEETARQMSLRLLGESLATRMGPVLGSTTPADDVTTVSKELRGVIGRVTDTWVSPTCTAYAIAEVTLDDFTYVLRGPALSTTARTLLLEHAATVVGP